MIYLLLSLFLGPSVQPPAFKQAIQAVGSTRALSVRLDGSLEGKGLSGATEIEIAYVRPDQFYAKIVEPKQASSSGSNRAYLIDGTSFKAVDYVQSTYLTRKISASPLEDRISVLGDLGAGVSLTLDPMAMKAFLDGFSGVENWRVARTGGEMVIVGNPKPPSAYKKVTLHFSTKTRFMTAAELISDKGVTRWKYTYGQPPKKLSLAIPSSARKVAAFTVGGTPPKYVGSEAKAVVEKALGGFDRMQDVAYRVQDADGVTLVWYSGGKIRQRDATADWTFGHGQLTLIDLRKNVVYQGKCGPQDIYTYLGRLGTRLEPFARKLITLKDPLTPILDDDAEAEVVGEMAVEGAPCYILEIRQKGLRNSFMIRKDNGLIARMVTENYDSQNIIRARSERTLTYASAGVRLQPDSFAIPTSGKSVKPLSALK